MLRPGTAGTGHDHLEPGDGLGQVDRPQPAPTGTRRQPPREHRGEPGLVDLDDEPCAGDEGAYPGHVSGDALGERGREVTAGAGVREETVGPGPLDRRGRRPRTADLHLERPVPPVERLGHLVEVLPEEGRRSGEVAPGPVGQTPARGLELDVEVDEETRGAPDHVGPGAARGQLGDVRHAVAEQVTDGAHGLAGARARPAAHPRDVPGDLRAGHRYRRRSASTDAGTGASVPGSDTGSPATVRSGTTPCHTP